jgi:hypothetical protein
MLLRQQILCLSECNPVQIKSAKSDFTDSMPEIAEIKRRQDGDPGLITANLSGFVWVVYAQSA